MFMQYYSVANSTYFKINSLILEYLEPQVDFGKLDQGCELIITPKEWRRSSANLPSSSIGQTLSDTNNSSESLVSFLSDLPKSISTLKPIQKFGRC